MRKTVRIIRAATSHNTANTDTHFIYMAKLNLCERNSCVRSITFAAGKIDLLIGGKSNGVVCRNVSRHAAQLIAMLKLRLAQR